MCVDRGTSPQGLSFVKMTDGGLSDRTGSSSLQVLSLRAHRFSLNTLGLHNFTAVRIKRVQSFRWLRRRHRCDRGRRGCRAFVHKQEK